MLVWVVLVRPGQRLIDPPEAKVGTEQGEAHRRLAQQRVEQRGVGGVQLGRARQRHGSVRPVHRQAISGLMMSGLTAGTGATCTDLPSAAPSCSLYAYRAARIGLRSLDAVAA